MSKKVVHSHFTSSRQENYGRRFAIFVSVALHLGTIAGLWLFSQDPKPKPQLLSATPVTLATNPNRSSGKKSKAPVAGRKKSSKPKSKPPVKKNVKKPEPKKSTNEVGLNREKKPPVKTPPPPEETKPTSSKSLDKSPPDEPVEPEDDRTIPIARGGFGGTKDSGISFEMGSPNPNIDVKDYEFASYFRLVHDQISRRWSRGGLTGGVTTIRFHIHRNGKITDAEIIHSAGQAYLDNPAKFAVIGADLPPLPQGIREDLLIVNINFHYYNPK